MKTILERIDMILREVDYFNEGKGDDEAYEKLFRKLLKKYGVKEPDELSAKEKKKFFKEIEDTWRKEDKSTNDKDR